MINKGYQYHTYNFQKESFQGAHVLFHEVETFLCLKIFSMVLDIGNRKNMCIHYCILLHSGLRPLPIVINT